MPEGDSVYVLARRLDVLNGRTLSRGDLRVPQHATDDLRGHTVLAQVTHGKHWLTRFDGELTLHTHLRMDGSWTVVRPVEAAATGSAAGSPSPAASNPPPLTAADQAR